MKHVSLLNCSMCAADKFLNTRYRFNRLKLATIHNLYVKNRFKVKNLSILVHKFIFFATKDGEDVWTADMGNSGPETRISAVQTSALSFSRVYLN